MPHSLTELDAINLMLETIGAAPVNRLTGVQNEDVLIARQILTQVSREVQTEEWDFNSEDDYPFTPDEEGIIHVPDNIIRIVPSNNHATPFWGPTDVVIRGKRLYDRANHTFTFSGPFMADIALFLDFDELPYEAKQYILIRACRKFDVVSSGDTDREKWTAQDELRARADLLAADTRQANSHFGRMISIDPLIQVQFSR